MTVTGNERLARSSPFAASIHGAERAVRLDDETERLALLHIQGKGALQRLVAALGDGPAEPGMVSESGAALVVALRPDIAVVLAPATEMAMVTRQIAAAAGEGLSVLDFSHGRGMMTLSGQAGPAVLSKLCGLDFGERAFADRHAAQTSLAKVRALIVRADERPARRYILVVDRSHAAYVWEAIGDAMEEFLDG